MIRNAKMPMKKYMLCKELLTFAPKIHEYKVVRWLSFWWTGFILGSTLSQKSGTADSLPPVCCLRVHRALHYSAPHYQVGIVSFRLISVRWNEHLVTVMPLYLSYTGLHRELLLIGCWGGGCYLIGGVWGRVYSGTVNFFKLLSDIWVTYTSSLITTLEIRRTSIVRQMGKS